MISPYDPDTIVDAVPIDVDDEPTQVIARPRTITAQLGSAARFVVTRHPVRLHLPVKRVP